MTLPSKDDFATFGGSKQNYADVEDPTTDRDATEVNTALADVAMMTRTAPRGWFILTTHASAPTVSSTHETMWGTGDSLKPTPTRTGAGVFPVTYPTSVTDALGNLQALNLQVACAEINDVAFGGFARARVTSANVITVYTYSTAFAANDIAGATVKVWFW